MIVLWYIPVFILIYLLVNSKLGYKVYEDQAVKNSCEAMLKQIAIQDEFRMKEYERQRLISG
jgi:hypothetical protein